MTPNDCHKWQVNDESCTCQVHAANAAIEASGVPKASFDSVCVGNVLSASAVDTAYIARFVFV